MRYGSTYKMEDRVKSQCYGTRFYCKCVQGRHPRGRVGGCAIETRRRVKCQALVCGARSPAAQRRWRNGRVCRQGVCVDQVPCTPHHTPPHHTTPPTTNRWQRAAAQRWSTRHLSTCRITSFRMPPCRIRLMTPNMLRFLLVVPRPARLPVCQVGKVGN